MQENGEQMTELTEGTWVLVADGEKALFLENITDAEDPHFVVRREVAEANPPTREQGTAPPGRRSDGGPGQRSAMDETDWHKLERLRFADELADLIVRRHQAGGFTRIVLVASAEVLGELRAKLPRHVREAVVAEVPKVLTNHPIDRIESLVARELAGLG